MATEPTVTSLLRLAREVYAGERRREREGAALLVDFQNHAKTPEIFDACRELSSSASKSDRVLASDILAAVSYPEVRGRLSFEGVSQVLMRLAEDRELSVRCAALIALGRWALSATERIVIAGAVSSSERERVAATRALAGFDSAVATQTLLGLLASDSAEVRQWAILSLGSRDHAEIRDGILSAATNGDPETKEEAFLALAERRDDRVVALLRRHLEGGVEIGKGRRRSGERGAQQGAVSGSGSAPRVVGSRS